VMQTRATTTTVGKTIKTRKRTPDAENAHDNEQLHVSNDDHEPVLHDENESDDEETKIVTPPLPPPPSNTMVDSSTARTSASCTSAIAASTCNTPTKLFHYNYRDIPSPQRTPAFSSSSTFMHTQPNCIPTTSHLRRPDEDTARSSAPGHVSTTTTTIAPHADHSHAMIKTPRAIRVRNPGNLLLDLSQIVDTSSSSSASTNPHASAVYPKISKTDYASVCSQVTDFLFVGGAVVAARQEILLAHGITHIINCAASVTPSFFPHLFSYYHLRLRDHASQDIHRYFYNIFHFIDRARTTNGKVGRRYIYIYIYMHP
jgi:hypothetical protein